MNTKNFDFEDFKTAGEQFMTRLTTKLTEVGLPVQSLTSDHLCFRVGTPEEYDLYKTDLSRHGQLLSEAMINGRPISTFRLASAFQTHAHQIPLVELPAPKPGTSYRTGFEHAEFVIKESFASFRAKFPHLQFTEGGNKTLNPELCLKLGTGIQAKFHPLSLDQVIELEEVSLSGFS